MPMNGREILWLILGQILNIWYNTYVMSIIKTILLFIILLSVIVLIHEFGHLVVAKLFGVYCQEFSIGMGPKLFSKKGKETEYSIRAIPYGGFVAMAGDTDNSLETQVDITNIPKERTLTGIAPWKRILIMLAGIFMNIVLATFIMAMLLLHNGSYAVSPGPTIKTTVKEYPAYEAGIRDNDYILSATLENGSSIKPDTFMELSSFLNQYDGVGKVYFEVQRGEEVLNISVKPVYVEAEERYLFGINSKDYERVEVNFFNCWGYAIDYLLMITKLLISALKDIFLGRGLNNLSGPVGVFNTTSEAIAMGPEYYFELMALISLNVGIFNALPLPILDGGRVLLTIIEVIIGRPIPEKFQNAVMTISLLIILLLVFFSTYQDIVRLLK